MKKLFYLLLFLLSSSDVVYAGNISKDAANDYDKMCKIYTEAYQQKSFMAKNAAERADYINNKLTGSLQASTLNTLQKIAQVDPIEEYNFKKEAAELASGKSWDCAAIKNADLSY